MTDEARGDKASATRPAGADPFLTARTDQDASGSVAESPPARIGRYTLERLLGVGGFGQVYLGFDSQLKRHVAIKVPHARLVAGEKDTQEYLAEAQVLAGLDHPHIVPVYDVGSTDRVPCYVVSKYIEGTDLAARIKDGRLSHVDSARVAATVAEALHYAHTRGLVHRDVKPSNILLGQDDHPYVADFGLALREADLGRGARYAGTPAYMSPEQARGEGHRVDGRSDVYGLGAVLYELLCGRRAFVADSTAELIELAASHDAKPPRQIDDTIPRELERICLKAMSRLASDRFTTAKDMADDLKHFLQEVSATPTPVPAPALDTRRVEQPASGSDWTPPDSGGRPMRIVPKGLRSFDEHDADFFLELLPGPRDRDGTPESIRFWKTRIEQVDPDKTFVVGLLYGPSGCGKSSLAKAGLLPRLSSRVRTVFVECAAVGTESRLLRSLCKRCPGLPAEAGLRASLAALRRGEGVPAGGKVLIVLDQFEQWLHANRDERDAELARALRQCDGEHVQCLLMVRDDFWLAVSRFMRELEVRLVEGENSMLVDLFDPHHARKVLAAFGRAYGALPADTPKLSREQAGFLDEAIAGLQQDGKIVCVRLGLFAELIKAKPWTPATLREVGGAQGVGNAFLEATFSSTAAPLEHRYHRKAVQAVLKALLPPGGSNIRGGMQSYETLLAASGYASRRADFDELLRLLDNQLRLITPADPESAPDDDWRADTETKAPESIARAPLATRHYQLTHDYLVPSLRAWLAREQKASRRGRAELLLAELATLWIAKPERRRLPNWREHARIRAFARSRAWSAPQRAMMRAATRWHATILVILLVLAGLAGWSLFELHGATRGEMLVRSLATAEIDDVPDMVAGLAGYRRWCDSRLSRIADSAKSGAKARLHAHLALLPVDSARVGYVRQRLLTAEPNEVAVIARLLLPHKNVLRDNFWTLLADRSGGAGPERLRAACALAAMDGTSDTWHAAADGVVDQLVRVRPGLLSHWQESLRPVGGYLAPALSRAARDGGLSPVERSVATDILADYATSRPDVLADAIGYADAEQFELYVSLLKGHRPAAIPCLEAMLAEEPVATWHDAPLLDAWKPPDPSVVHSLEAAQGIVAERFAFCQTMPLEQCVSVAERLGQSGYRLTRFRPFLAESQIRVAANWTRDGRAWQLTSGPPEQVRGQQQQLSSDGWLPLDVANYLVVAEAGEEQVHVAVVWVRSQGDAPDRRLWICLPSEQSLQETARAAEDGYRQVERISVVHPRSAAPVVSAMVGRSDEAGATYSGAGAGYASKSRLDLLQVDAGVVRAPAGRSVRDRFLEERQAAEAVLAAHPDDFPARRELAVANFRLGHTEEAGEQLAALAREEHRDLSVWLYATLLHAQAGRAPEARDALEKFKDFCNDSDAELLLAAAVEAHAGVEGDSLRTLHGTVSHRERDLDFQVNAARVFSIASVAMADPERARAYATQALSVLRAAISQGFDDYATLQADPDLEQLSRLPEFAELMEGGKLDRHYSAVWRRDASWQSAELHGVDPKEALARSRALIADGYRPVSLSAGSFAGGRLEATMVWHRPSISETEQETVAKRRANAAAALWRLGHTAGAWSVLKHEPDPRARSNLIHGRKQWGMDVQAIAERLESEPDVSVRRALCLAAGTCGPDACDAASRARLLEALQRQFREHPDAGLHAASRWALCRWDGGPYVAETEAALREREPEVARRAPEYQRQWYVTSEGHTMVILAAGQFLMGSPATEAHRDQGERYHPMKIGRRFALAATEVSLAQWRAFQSSSSDAVADLVEHEQIKELCRTEDTSIAAMTWYEAAAYCNWLSEREGIPEDQWCYERNQDGDFAAGMRAKADYLKLRGYRLPSEAEWEYACRAGATTARYYGESTELLPHYAWFVANSGKRLHPAASLMPNDFGLFDMLGGVCEWCHEMSTTVLQIHEDTGDATEVVDDESRLVRGGAFLSTSDSVRAAYRDFNQPGMRQLAIGFRVARTIP